MKKGTFTSVWDGGNEVVSDAELNEITGEVIAETVDVYGLDLEILEREFFTDEQGNEYTVCPECHKFIMTTKMFDGIGHTYNEREVCSDPDCDSNFDGVGHSIFETI